GSEVFDAISEWKQRHAQSRFTITLGTPADASATFNGEEADITPALETTAPQRSGGRPAAAAPSFRRTRATWTALGLSVPTFALANFGVIDQALGGPSTRMHVRFLAGHESAARDYAGVVHDVAPVVAEWLGEPKHSLEIIELADANA